MTIPKEKILLVDDEEALRGILSKGLGARGYICDQAENGDQAMTKLETNPTDLVIMDIGTPHTVRKEELHTASQFSPWDGWELNCWPTLTMLRGQVIFENGKLLKEKTGKYLPRYPFGAGR